MKKGLTILLMFVILLQCGIKSIYVAYYNINQDYIASVLCINKAKPASACNGKCYLAKKMKEQEQQEQTIPSVLKGLEKVVLFCSEHSIALTQYFSVSSTVAVAQYKMNEYSSPTDLIIQPPQ
jgi:hypothetical protein